MGLEEEGEAAGGAQERLGEGELQVELQADLGPARHHTAPP